MNFNAFEYTAYQVSRCGALVLSGFAGVFIFMPGTVKFCPAGRGEISRAI
jgi:trehalose-6-phosphate synthase